MYEPNIKLTAKLQDSLKEIEEVRQLLHTIPILPIVEEPIKRQALVETVYYTARIEGNPLDISAVEKLGSHPSPPPELSRDQQEHANLYKVMDFVRQVASETGVPITEEVIKQIHAFVVRDIPSQGLPGVYKSAANEIKDQVTGERVYLPPSPSESVQLMIGLSTWLSREPLAIHAVIAAGIAHLELVAIHPFDNGNGRTARALADLILYRNGYTFRYLFSWVRQVGIDTETYYLRLRQVLGSKYGANTDPSIWIEYFAEAVAMSLSQKKPDLVRLRQVFVESYNLGEKAGLARDQIEAIVYATLHGSVTTGTYMNVTGLSRSTVIKRLGELVDAGVMHIEGKGRTVRYVLTSRGTPSFRGKKPEGTPLDFESVIDE